MLYAGLALGLIAVLLVLFFGSIRKRSRVVGQRPEELRQLGASLGLQPVAVEDPEDNTLDRELLRGSTLSETVEGMDGGLGQCVQGERDGFTVLLGDFFRSVAGGRMPSAMHTVLLIQARQGSFPRFFLLPLAHDVRPKTVAGCAEPERYQQLAPPEVGQRATLTAHQEDREWVQGALSSAEARELLESAQARHLSAEGLGDRLLLQTWEQVVPAEGLERLVTSGLRLAQLLHRSDPYRG